MYGALFCTDCGLEHGKTPYDNNDKGTCGHPHLVEKNGMSYCTNCGLFEGYEFVNDLCIPRSHYAEIQKSKTNLNENSKVNELREAAKANGVKCVTMRSKKRLCEVFGIENQNKGKYILKNIKTGEEHRLKNQKEIADKFGIRQGSLSFLLKKGRVNANGNTYSLKKTLNNLLIKMDDETLFKKMMLEYKKSFLKYLYTGVYVETKLFRQLVRIKVKNIIEANPHIEGVIVGFFMKSKFFFEKTYQKKNPSYIFLKKIVVPALKKDHRKVVKHEQRMLSFLANEMDKAGRNVEAHVVRTIVKPHLKEMKKDWEEMTAMQKFKVAERKFFK